jgi:hypothetical protein
MQTGERPEVMKLTKKHTKAIAAVMLMETFDRLSRKEKYVWDVSYSDWLMIDAA